MPLKHSIEVHQTACHTTGAAFGSFDVAAHLHVCSWGEQVLHLHYHKLAHRQRGVWGGTRFYGSAGKRKLRARDAKRLADRLLSGGKVLELTEIY